MTQSTVSLRVFGDELDPDEITQLLGRAPTSSYRKGDPISQRRGTGTRKGGMWNLSAPESQPDNFPAQVEALLSSLTQDLNTWQSLRQRYTVDLFCGFFMDTSNQGFSLPLPTIAALAARHIEPGFDIYAPTEEEEAQYWANEEDDNLAAGSGAARRPSH